MATNTLFVPCTVGTWTQLCEQRPTRKALMVQLLGGSCVLGINTSGPSVYNQFGVTPMGMFHSDTNGGGPSIFRLSEELDGDLAHQSWFAYPIFGSQQNSALVLNTQAFTAGQASTIWTPPVFVTTYADVYCWGRGGNSGASGAALGGGGGGGGGFARTGPIVVNPGQSWTYQVDSAALAIGISRASYPSPATVLDCGSGANGVLALGGLGGLGNIGNERTSGGNGGTVTGLGGVGGGGGGGAGVGQGGGAASGQTGGFGGGALSLGNYGQGSRGATGAALTQGGGAGLSIGGGASGAATTIAGVALGGTGAVIFFYYTNYPPAVWTPAICVIESYTVPAYDDPDWVDPSAMLTVNFPRLSRGGVNALNDLLARIRSKDTEKDDDESEGDT